MSENEKTVLNGIVQHLENLLVGLDAIERSLIERGLIADGERQLLEPQYRVAASQDLQAIRSSIATL